MQRQVTIKRLFSGGTEITIGNQTQVLPYAITKPHHLASYEAVYASAYCGWRGGLGRRLTDALTHALAAEADKNTKTAK